MGGSYLKQNSFIKRSSNENNKISKDNQTFIQVIKNVLKLSELSKRYESKTLYIVLVFLGFFVYTLAYVFFYGYYFSGQSGDLPSMIQAFVNPVPFNFKPLTIIGLSLIVVLLVLTNMAYIMVTSLKSNPIEFIVDLIILVALIIFIQICFSIAFVGTYRLRFQDIRIWGYPILLILFSSFINSGKGRYFFWSLLGAVDIFLIAGIVSTISGIEFKNSYGYSIFFTAWLVLSIISLFYRIIKCIIGFNLFVIAFLILSVLMKNQNLISHKTIIIFVISLICVLLLFRFYNYLRGLIMKRHHTDKHKLVRNLDFYIGVEFIIQKYKFVFLPVFALILIALAYSSTYDLGRSLQKSLSQETYDIISYYSNTSMNSPNTIVGNIISYKDGVYYISNDKKELITLKNSIVETKPKK
jgi:hypothetical protein